ncbi:DUF2332 domain-containing protein [Frigidibacter oleivorans]|uniref:DUF2332 domain-containing protein n=1 Tax=Frigidibacter oleivorans TaxID=2487129 RepID=UPI000F8ECA3F|nr:DUF2332 family protein [Frigidibacter oleivorans]
MTWRAAFLQQARSCEDLGSPFTARLLAGIAERGLPEGAIAARIAGWQGDIGPSGASVPLRLAGALHGLVLEGRAPDLAAVYPPAAPAGAVLAGAVDAALTAHEDRVMARLDSAPQTNEVARSAAVIPAAHWLARRFRLPLVLSELGASAGLNLNFDRYALQAGGATLGPGDPVLTLAPDWRGQAPVAGPLQIAARAGVDLAPIDPARDRLRLLSFVWADQAARLSRIAAALDEAARHPPAVERGDAAGWLAGRLAAPMPGRLHLIYHTVAWQYFPAAAQQQALAALQAAGGAARPDAPLARFSMEADGQGPGAALRLTLWPGDGTGRDLRMGRADFHGRWIDWQPEEAA